MASAGVTVSDSGYPSDTGIMGTGLGEYIIESMVLNVQGATAENYQFSLQSPGGITSRTWWRMPEELMVWTLL